MSMMNLGYIALVWKILNEKLLKMVVETTATSDSTHCTKNIGK